jgi:hypothetical protein
MIDRVANPTPATSQDLTYKDRHGSAMGWVFSALGMFLLLGGLALGASVIFSVGIAGWHICMALMGLVIIGVIVALNTYILTPAR